MKLNVTLIILLPGIRISTSIGFTSNRVRVVIRVIRLLTIYRVEREPEHLHFLPIALMTPSLTI